MSRSPSTPKTAAKSAQRGSSRPAEAKNRSVSAPSLGEALGLVPTERPGVYRNRYGTLVDEHGILLGLAQMKIVEREDLSAVVGHEVKTPAEFLKAVALDPRVQLDTRIDAAKAAAPYTDRKQPTGVDGGLGADGTPLPIRVEMSVPPEVLAQLSEAELAAFDKVLTLLKAAGLAQ